MCATCLNGLRKRDLDVVWKGRERSANTPFNVQLFYISSSYVGPVWRRWWSVKASCCLIVFGMGFCKYDQLFTSRITEALEGREVRVMSCITSAFEGIFS